MTNVGFPQEKIIAARQLQSLLLCSNPKPAVGETGIVMVTKDDWRLTNQERFLKGATLGRRQYEPANEQDDHDHCEFCVVKFMRAGTTDALHEGYTTQDRYRWICPLCFDDFHDMFEWTVAP